MLHSVKFIESPVGRLGLVADDLHLCAVIFQRNWDREKGRFPSLTENETPVLKEARRQLTDYFDGRRRDFDLPLKLSGTVFQKKTWQALSGIPFGQTRTYAQQAVAVGRPRATRAVGRTNGLNLVSIVLPCHRVVAGDGSLTGYAGGLEAKRFLLKLEGAEKGLRG